MERLTKFRSQMARLLRYLQFQEHSIMQAGAYLAVSNGALNTFSSGITTGQIPIGFGMDRCSIRPALSHRSSPSQIPEADTPRPRQSRLLAGRGLERHSHQRSKMALLSRFP